MCRTPAGSSSFLLLLIPFGCSVLENFGYRQINVVWRLIGTWQWLRGKQGGWGAMQRKGMETKKMP